MSELEHWAASGAMALTGYPTGPPCAPTGSPATTIHAGLRALNLHIPGLLGERAAYAGFIRRAPWSPGGACRALATRDGHVALSLPRPEDLELVPALTGQAAVGDAWTAAAHWAASSTTAEAVDRLALLELAAGRIPPTPPTDRPGVVTTVLGDRRPSPTTTVLDLTSLWGGPLCAHLLGLQGARVVKVEGRGRPDGARRGPRDFYGLLHRGHRSVTLDFRDERDTLLQMFADADLVLEASRPRALRRLGIDAEDVVRAGTSWLSITACGRASEAAGYGDDVALRAGLCLRSPTGPLPVGDAIADPLAGVAAAVAAATALSSSEARLIDVSMLHVAAETAATDGAQPHHVSHDGEQWWVETASGRFQVMDPRVRP